MNDKEQRLREVLVDQFQSALWTPAQTVNGCVERTIKAIKASGLTLCGEGEVCVQKHAGREAINTDSGRWGMVSEALDGEPLPESINKTIYDLCDGLSVVVPVEPTEAMIVGLTGPNGYCSIPLKDAYKAITQAAQQQSKQGVDGD